MGVGGEDRFRVGGQVDKYEILGPLGRGGMATVYRALDISLNREVALKVLPGDVGESILARFRTEIDLLSRLRHPNVVHVFETGTLGGRFYYAMRLYDGPDLFGEKRVVRRVAEVAKMGGSTEDRGVAGAAAQVPLQRLGNGVVVGYRIAHIERIERHDDARRAESTLRSVELGERLLHRVWPAIGAAQMLDGDHMTAIERGQQPDARGHRFIGQFAVNKPPYQHGAGTAVTLGASLLGAGQALIEAKEIEQCLVGPERGEPDDPVVE